MAEVFKRDPESTKKPPETRMVIQRTEIETHSALDVLSRAAQVKPRDAYPTMAKADSAMTALRNREKHLDPIQLSKNFQALLEKMDV